MCPDIETFAPLISASFGLGGVLVEVWGEDEARLGARSVVRLTRARRQAGDHARNRLSIRPPDGGRPPS